MRSSAIPKVSANATDVKFTEDEMIVSLADGRTLSVPLVWFPRLKNARSHLRLIGSGIGVSWEALDEDISIPALLAG